MIFTEKKMTIPTYPIGPDEKNPMFFEKRNVQGAAGNIFPLPMNTSLTDEKVDVEYTALVMENEYVQTVILPELGGKIYRALDKANQYDFIYYNRVIKPALIGLCGPWTSGGIEFNWPQHHRPTTFSPVEYSLVENEDGSKTAWVGETEPLNRTKGMVGITMHPDKSYLKAEIRVTNRTDLPQSFMWWANLAVAVNEHYRAVFPPDIHWASDHAWATTSAFPVVKGQYKNVDMGKAGKDVRDYPNVATGASFFTYNSKYDFLSGYDFGVDAGVVHVADRHVSPGKKMFTWGVGESGIAWGGKLTDEDGPYIELMTGVFTCNQPDFSWIAPHETKRAEQFWYPIHGIGEVKNATIDAALAVDYQKDGIAVGINVTGAAGGNRIVVSRGGETVFEKSFAQMTPKDAYTIKAALPEGYLPHEFRVALYAADGRTLVGYQCEESPDLSVPEAYDPSPKPGALDTNEALYLHALHLFQYRHPYFDPEDYLAEALRRDPTDARCNTLMGRIMLQNANPEKAAQYLETAAKKQTDRNPNAYDTEAHYLLGIAQIWLGAYDAAYENLFLATWAYAHKSSGYALLAMLAARRGEHALALEHAEEALRAGGGNHNAIWIKAALLRHLGKTEAASALLGALVSADPLDLLARYELSKIGGTPFDAAELAAKPEYAIDIATRYALAGFYRDAAEALELQIKQRKFAPSLYHLGYVYRQMGDDARAAQNYRAAAELSPVGCLHGRPESLIVLRDAICAQEHDACAPYYLGNMLYAAHQYDEAIALFELSVSRGATFPTVFRNLSYGLFKTGDIDRAGALIRRAFELDPTDPYVFFDLCQYLRNTYAPVDERIALYEQYAALAAAMGRDDNYNTMCSTYLEKGDYAKAQELLRTHNYHSYEGGEGVSVRLHIASCLLPGILALEAGDADKALAHFVDARKIPENFHEGESVDAFVETAHVYYWLGRAHEALGDRKMAEQCYQTAIKDQLFSPELKYYVAAAMRKLGLLGEADAMAKNMLSEVEAAVAEAGAYGYFRSITMPSYLPYEGDKARKDLDALRYLRALALLANGKKSEAAHAFKEAAQACAADYKSAFISAHIEAFA